MVVTFEYQISWTRRGVMTVNLEEFFPNRVRKTRKLFQLMVPGLDSLTIQEIEEWLSRKEDKRYKRYLEIFKEVQKK